MVNPTAIQKARDGKRAALDKLAAVIVVDTPTATTDSDMANKLGVSKQDMRNLRLDLIDLGLMRAKTVGGGRAGFRAEWTLLVNRDVARDRLEERWAEDDRTTVERLKEMGQSNSVRFTGKSRGGKSNGHQPSELVHVTGADAPKPMTALAPERYDEPRALVEAARQYAGLHKQVDQKIKELEALGITVDREKLSKAVALPSDPRLVYVAQAMPYIEQLERHHDRLVAQVADYKEKLGNLPSLQGENNRLHEQNRRLVSDNARLREQLEQRPQRQAPVPVMANGATAGK